MKKLPDITTRQGDGGLTRLYSGEQVPKDHPRLEACGDVDELVTVMGMARAYARSRTLREHLLHIQRMLFRVGSEAATDRARRSSLRNRVGAGDVAALERMCLVWDKAGRPRDFVVPGGSPPSAWLDFARAVARRCERRLVGLSRRGDLDNPDLLKWINRLSDLLWLMARAAEKRATPVRSNRKRS